MTLYGYSPVLLTLMTFGLSTAYYQSSHWTTPQDPFGIMFGDAAARAKGTKLINEMLNSIVDPQKKEKAKAEVSALPDTVIAQSLLRTVVNSSASEFRRETKEQLTEVLSILRGVRLHEDIMKIEIKELKTVKNDLEQVLSNQQAIIQMLERKLADQERKLEAAKKAAATPAPTVPPPYYSPPSPYEPPNYPYLPRPVPPPVDPTYQQPQAPQQPPQPYSQEGSGAETRQGAYVDMNFGGAEVIHPRMGVSRTSGGKLSIGIGNAYNGPDNQKTMWNHRLHRPEDAVAGQFIGDD